MSTIRPTLTVDLQALQENFKTLQSRRPEAETAAVVKANAYGLGMSDVAPALAKAGCRTFFVTYTFEGEELRQILSQAGYAANICIFNGPGAADIGTYKKHCLTPVLNTIDQLELWQDQDERPCLLHVDTGMNRLGLTRDEVEKVCNSADKYLSLSVSHIISHFASSSNPKATANSDQLAVFLEVIEKLSLIYPNAGKSISASGGLFLPHDIKEELTRPGLALYGGGPMDKPEASLKTVATLKAPVMQIREIQPGEAVGYSGTFKAEKSTRLATLGIGYGDGFPRHLSNKGKVYIGGKLCPIVGTISMDLITVNISDCTETVSVGQMAECFGPNYPIEDQAASGDTISYELLVTLGDRVARQYMN